MPQSQSPVATRGRWSSVGVFIFTEFPSSAAQLGDVNGLWPATVRCLDKYRQVLRMRLDRNMKISHRCDSNYRPVIGQAMGGTPPVCEQAIGHCAITGRVFTDFEYRAVDVRPVLGIVG